MRRGSRSGLHGGRSSSRTSRLIVHLTTQPQPLAVLLELRFHTRLHIVQRLFRRFVHQCDLIKGIVHLRLIFRPDADLWRQDDVLATWRFREELDKWVRMVLPELLAHLN